MSGQLGSPLAGSATSSHDPLIILTCMRSFSSLACGMIGQHPQLYGLPELNPFIADTLGQAMAALRLTRPIRLSGLLRALAEIEYGEQTDQSVARAKLWLDRRRSWSMKRLLDYISERVAPKIVVEKSPSTSLSMRHLERAVEMYPDAFFIHLTRHPRAVCKSIHALQSANAERGALAGFRQQNVADPEVLWTRTNSNIIRISRQIPSERFIQLRGEDILADPRNYLGQFCNWLGLDFDEASLDHMLHPENSPYACIGPRAAPFGNDPNFLHNPVYENRALAISSLEGPLEWRNDGGGFREESCEIAAYLGYT